MRIAVAGATGYIGGRLVPLLLEAGHELVCLARTPAKLDDRPWRSHVEVREADVLDPDRIRSALNGCEAAYYLIHSMGDQKHFGEAEERAATNFAAGAEHNGLARIVYLGGLGRATEEAELSPHLASRHRVGEVLASGSTPVTELRAAVIIGSGSMSFEMLRYLTEVLPVMTTPRWVETRCQPISIRAVLSLLVAGLDDTDGSHIYEIGGPDVLSYRDLMQLYADVAGLRRRLVIPVPVLSPSLSSLWVGLVTPLPVGVARPLVDSLVNEVTVDEDRTAPFDVSPMSLREAITEALSQDGELDVPSRWSDASTSPARAFAWDPDWSGGTLLVDRQSVGTGAPAHALFPAFTRVGGNVGYYALNWAWRVRGLLDTLVGGVGLRRGRRHPTEVRLHDTIDFWRVSAVEPGVHLQLSAEMRLPGQAWLEWRVADDGDVRRLEQTAYFRPRGLAGRAYWYAMLPFHHLIFGRMARRIVEEAEAGSS